MVQSSSLQRRKNDVLPAAIPTDARPSSIAAVFLDEAPGGLILVERDGRVALCSAEARRLATSPLPCWPSPISQPSGRAPSGGVDLKSLAEDLLPLTVPEVRHLIAAVIAKPSLDRQQLFRWSEWRRRHQQRARRAHWTRRAWRPP